MISVAFKTPLKNKIGNLYLLNCTSESTRWLHWFRTKLSPPHFTTKLRPYLHPLFTGLIKTEKFSFSEMLRREFYLWPLAKKLYDGWINTMTLSNENSWKLPPPPKWRAGCAPGVIPCLCSLPTEPWPEGLQIVDFTYVQVEMIFSNPLIYSVSYFTLKDLELCLGG